MTGPGLETRSGGKERKREMGSRVTNFFRKLLATFKVEAEEHLQALSSGLLELEKTASPNRRREVVERIFREAHSLKGAARAVNLHAVENACQALESVFSALKRGGVLLQRAHLDLVHEMIETIRGLVRSGESEPEPAVKARLARFVEDLEQVRRDLPLEAGRAESWVAVEGFAEEALGPPLVPAEKRAPIAETVRIPTARLDSLFLRTQELLASGASARQRNYELREVLAEVVACRKRLRELGPDLQTSRRELANANGRAHSGRTHTASWLLEILGGQDDFLKSLESRLKTAVRTAELNQEQLSAQLHALLEETKQTLMLPFSSLLETFPPLVRRLARERGKEVELVAQGEEIEIDKRILEELKDPLIHIVRNSIDHAIEEPEVRKRAGKNSQGTVTIALAQRNGKVDLRVSDDGGGIALEKVRVAAVKLGLVSAEEATRLDDQHILDLVFESGVSTSPLITDLSGRGLGLAIVREKVEKLGGLVSLDTRPGAGTTLRLLIPVTLATFRGVLVCVGDRSFVVPTAHVERVLRVERKEVKTVENRETISVNGQAVSLVRLEDVLELPHRAGREDTGERMLLLLLFSGERRIAFAVDEIHADQEVLVKDLGRQLARVRNVAGATVLGKGQVVPILNVADLMKSAVKARGEAAPGPAAVETRVAKRSILVAEDSITARTLLRNILESAGYDVRTAVDGAEALTLLKTEPFDLLVSDVDMPRMNGFELTAKVRAEKKISDLPVVLVTALESREDRERGIEAGANAYIVKSSFDQTNLLAVIRTLI